MTKRLPYPASLNFKQRKPQHRWSQEERIILCCMRRFFNLSNRDIEKVFNHLYESKIRSEGFPNGVPRSTLVTQWEDVRRKRHPDFVFVHQDVRFEQGATQFAVLFDKISSACQKLHIALVPRARDLDISRQERTTHPEQCSRPRPYPLSAMTMPAQERRKIANNGSSGILPSDEQVQQATPIQQNQEVSRPISLIRSYTLNKHTTSPVQPSNVPTLLWRFSNEDSMGINHRSGYIAAAFINDIGNIPLPQERVQEFPTWLEIHVRPRKIPTPFISTSIDPLIPIHRALTRGKDAFVTLIDSNQINLEHIYYVKDLMGRYNIYTPGYRGAKEYVIWGMICRKAIVLSFKADQLVDIANKHSDINIALQLDVISESPNCKLQLYQKLATKVFESDFTIGKTVGKLLKLLDLQEEYVDDVAVAFNASWSFTRSDDTAEFIRGVQKGYQDAITSPIQSQSQTSFSYSQASTSQSQDQTSPNDETDQIDESIQDIQDYVIVDLTEQDVSDRTYQDQQLRQSIDRLSIADESQRGFANTVATRRISMFNQESESWVMVPESQDSTTEKKPVIDSIEHDDSSDVKPTTIAGSSSDNEETDIKTPRNSPEIRHDRTDSESTIGQQTPTNRGLSEERSHIDRVLGIDWASFWDSMQNHAQ